MVSINIFLKDLNNLKNSSRLVIARSIKNSKTKDHKPLCKTISSVSTWFNSLKKIGWGSPQKTEAIQVNSMPLKKVSFINLGWADFYSFCI